MPGLAEDDPLFKAFASLDLQEIELMTIHKALDGFQTDPTHLVHRWVAQLCPADTPKSSFRDLPPALLQNMTSITTLLFHINTRKKSIVVMIVSLVFLDDPQEAVH